MLTAAIMAVRETITVSLAPELRAFIRAQLTSGRYGNASEVVRAGLRLLERDESGMSRRSLDVVSTGRGTDRV